MKEANRRPGEYNIKHKGSGHEFRMKKHNQNASGQANNGDYEELQEMEGVTAMIFMGILMSFAFACCCSVCCMSCILGGLYKYHFTTKELDIIQGMPSVSQVNMQQFPAHQVQQPNLSENVVRGQVVMMPQVQEP